MVGRGGDDRETGGSWARDPARGAGAERVDAAGVQDQRAERGDAIVGRDSQDAAESETAGPAGHGQRHLIGAVADGEIAEAVKDLDRDGGADRYAGPGGSRLHAARQEVG